MEQKPDILEGVRLLSKAIDEQGNTDYGMLMFYYDPNPVTLDISTRVNFSGNEEMMSAVIAAMMSRDETVRTVIINAVETYKNMANG